MPDFDVSPEEFLVSSAAEEHGVDKDLALKVARQESNLNPSAVSPKGAEGVMQLMPDTAKALGVDPRDAHQNIQGGVRYLKQLLDRYDGDTQKALAAYNAGPGTVDRGGPLPKETQDYVSKIGGFTVSPEDYLKSDQPASQGWSLSPEQFLSTETPQADARGIVQMPGTDFRQVTKAAQPIVPNNAQQPGEPGVVHAPGDYQIQEPTEPTVKGGLITLGIPPKGQGPSTPIEFTQQYRRAQQALQPEEPVGLKETGQALTDAASKSIVDTEKLGKDLDFLDVFPLFSLEKGAVLAGAKLLSPANAALALGTAGAGELGAVGKAVQAGAMTYFGAKGVATGGKEAAAGAQEAAGGDWAKGLERVGFGGATALLGALAARAGLQGGGELYVKQLRDASQAHQALADQAAPKPGGGSPETPSQPEGPVSIRYTRPDGTEETYSFGEETKPTEEHAQHLTERYAQPDGTIVEVTVPTEFATSIKKNGSLLDSILDEMEAKPAEGTKPAETAPEPSKPAGLLDAITDESQPPGEKAPPPPPAEIPAAVPTEPNEPAAPPAATTPEPEEEPKQPAAAAPPTPEEPKKEQPEKQQLEGDQVRIKTARGTTTMARYRLVEADDLNTSHDTALNPNPSYPQELQPRDRTRKASDAQINEIAGKLDPAELGASYKASDGAPVVTTDNTVVSGNGRSIALKRLYDSGHENGSKYRGWLADNAQEFGLDPEQVEGMRKPVLVRSINPEGMDLPEFAKESNEDSKAAMSASETARTDAQRLSPGHMAVFNPSPEGDLSASSNRTFLTSFFQDVVPSGDRGALMDSTGQISQAGLNRVRNAVFAKAYGAEGSTLEKLSESTDSNIRNVTAGMVQAAGSFAKMREGIASGNLHNLDLSDEVSEAAEQLGALRREGSSVPDYLRQIGLFGDDMTPEAKSLLEMFDRHGRSPKKIGTILRKYTEAVEAAGSPKQESMFGGEAPGKEDILAAAIQEAEGEFKRERQRPVSDSLFDEGGSGQGSQDTRGNAPAKGNAGSPGTAESPAGTAAGKIKAGLKKSASAPEHDYSSTQTNLPDHVAEPMRQFAQSIPDDKLAEDGRESEPHITVKYGLHGEDAAPVEKLLENEPPIIATLGKASLFQNDDADVLKVDIDSPDLHRLNAKIAEALPNTDTHPTYKPHATIAYLLPGEGKQYDGKDIPGVTGQKVTMPSITFSGKDGQKTEIPLTGGGKIQAGLKQGRPEGLASRREPSTESKQGGPGLWTAPNGKVIPLKGEIPTHGGTAMEITGKKTSAEAVPELLNRGYVRVRGPNIQLGANAQWPAIQAAMKEARANADEAGEASVYVEGPNGIAQIPIGKVGSFLASYQGGGLAARGSAARPIAKFRGAAAPFAPSQVIAKAGEASLGTGRDEKTLEIALSPAMLKLLNEVVDNHAGGGEFVGIFMPHDYLGSLRWSIGDEIKSTHDPKKRKQLSNLLSIVVKAQARRKRVVLTTAGDEPYLHHEYAHVAQHDIAMPGREHINSKKFVEGLYKQFKENLPELGSVGKRAAYALDALGYNINNDDELVSEIGAHLEQGPTGWKLMRLSPANAEKLRRFYLKALLKEHSIEKLRAAGFWRILEPFDVKRKTALHLGDNQGAKEGRRYAQVAGDSNPGADRSPRQGSRQGDRRVASNEGPLGAQARAGRPNRLVASPVPAPLSQVADLVTSTRHDLQKAFNPAGIDLSGLQAGVSLREHSAEAAKVFARAEEAMDEAKSFFAGKPWKLNLDFIDKLETGEKQPNEKLQKIADVMRDLLDSHRESVQALGKNKLTQFYENYFPHIWKRPEQAVDAWKQILGRRPIEGPKSFLKQRKFRSFREGVDAGLEPVSENPVDLVLLKLKEMERYVTAHRYLNEMRGIGLAKYVPSVGKKNVPPEGWVKIPDAIGTVWRPPMVPVKEALDREMVDGLNRVLENLHIAHTRETGGKKGQWGLASWPPPQILTKFGGPESVLIHEIGHILDHEFGLQGEIEKKSKNGNLFGINPEELRALADLRLTGNEPKWYENYVHKPAEQIANMVAAYVHTRSRMKRIAPNVYKWFDQFVQNHPEISELRNLEYGMQIQEQTGEMNVGGWIQAGNYYMPAAAAQVIQNHLSPGLGYKPLYRLVRSASNSMLQFALGFSAFHLGFTSMDAAISKLAIAIQYAFEGKPIEALSKAIEVPLAPVSNVIKGHKIRNAYLKAAITDPELSKYVDALTQGGGRVKMDDVYRTNFRRVFLDAWRQEDKEGVANVLRQKGVAATVAGIIPAIAETVVWPIMEWLVPRQKLGVFADMVDFELQRLGPNATKQEIRQVMAKAWDSVDNRMGQLVYDNLYWNRTAKDLAMVSVQSLGWNIGTGREIGGAAIDTVKAGAHIGRRFIGGGKSGGNGGGGNGRNLRTDPLFTRRIAYLIAMPLLTGAIGAVATYLVPDENGEHHLPRKAKDFFYPVLFGVRWALPTYIKDVVHWSESPIQAAENKLNPGLRTAVEIALNSDFNNSQIYNPNDKLYQQGVDILKHVGQGFVPFAWRNQSEMQKQGGGLGERAAVFVGITKAPSYIDRSKAERLLSEYLGENAPKSALSKEDADRKQARKDITDALKRNSPDAERIAMEALDAGRITAKDIEYAVASAGNASGSRLGYLAKENLEQALEVYRAATQEERAEFGPIIVKALGTAMRSKSQQQTQALLRRFPREIEELQGQ